MASLFDPHAGERLLAPDAPGPGHWVGAACPFRDPADGRLLLWVRDRRPPPARGRATAGDDFRGFRGRLLELAAEPEETPRELFAVHKRDLGARSIEGAALRRTDAGLELFVSYETAGRLPRWRVGVLRAATPERLDAHALAPVDWDLPPPFAWSVKDPVLHGHEGVTYLYVDGPRLGLPPITTAVLRAEGDGPFRYCGDLFAGSPRPPWTRALRRLTSILPLAGGSWGWLGFLDGAPRWRDVCEERAGVAWGPTPERLRLVDARPRFVSREGTASCRYLFARPLGPTGPGGAREVELSYELSVGEGGHALHRTRVPAAELEKLAPVEAVPARPVLAGELRAAQPGTAHIADACT